jgi:hypothetical protein
MQVIFTIQEIVVFDMDIFKKLDLMASNNGDRAVSALLKKILPLKDPQEFHRVSFY